MCYENLSLINSRFQDLARLKGILTLSARLTALWGWNSVENLVVPTL